MDRQELSRSGPGLAQIAGRYVEREGIDVKTELAKLEKSQGAAANRFDDTGGPLERLGDPQQARQMFKELDANSDGYLDRKGDVRGVSRAGGPVHRPCRTATATAGFREREFLDGAERVSKFLGRQMKEERKDLKAKKNERKSKSAESSSPGKK